MTIRGLTYLLIQVVLFGLAIGVVIWLRIH